MTGLVPLMTATLAATCGGLWEGDTVTLQGVSERLSSLHRECVVALSPADASGSGETYQITGIWRGGRYGVVVPPAEGREALRHPDAVHIHNHPRGTPHHSQADLRSIERRGRVGCITWRDEGGNTWRRCLPPADATVRLAQSSLPDDSLSEAEASSLPPQREQDQQQPAEAP